MQINFSKQDSNEIKLLKQYLGLAYKANALFLGTELVINGVRRDKVLLILICSDLSFNTEKKITDKASFYNVKLIKTNLTKSEMGDVLGKKNEVSCVGIKNLNFVELINKSLSKRDQKE